MKLSAERAEKISADPALGVVDTDEVLAAVG
jgi:hypothetical protein